MRAGMSGLNATTSPEDLSTILRNVAADARPSARQKIANSPETRGFLEVGVLLLQQDLMDHCGPDLADDEDAGTRILAGLSQARLIARGEQEDQHLDRPRLLTVGMFRDRWRYKSRYTEDLIAYVFRLSLFDQHLKTMENKIQQLISGSHSFTELVPMVLQAELDAQLTNPLLNIQTILRVAIPTHARVVEFSAGLYEFVLPKWADMIELIATQYGLRLRPDRTWLDVAELMNALTDGVGIRTRARGSVATLSTGESVLQGAIFAMLPSIFEGRID